MQVPFLRFVVALGAGSIMALAMPATPGKAQDMGGEFQVTSPGGLGGALSGALDKAGGAINSAQPATSGQGTVLITPPVTTKYREVHTHTYHPGAYRLVVHHFTGKTLPVHSPAVSASPQ